MRKRLLSTMLALCLTLTMLPMNALATDEPPTEETKIEAQVEEPITPENPTSEVPTEPESPKLATPVDTPVVNPKLTNDIPTNPPVTPESGDDESENPPEETPDNQNSSLITEDGQGEPMALATTSGTCGDNATWRLENGILTISGTGRINIYAYPWGFDKSLVRSIVINQGITNIGAAAFDGFSNLTSIRIPNSITTIENTAFRGCTSLANIALPNSITSMSNAVFKNCTSLTNITIPNRITDLEANMFENCTSLSSITIPNGVTRLGAGVFYNCTSLRNITIPNSVIRIEGGFMNCTSLTSITIPDSVTYIGAGTFWGCSNLASIKLPSNLTSTDATFSGCTNLSNVTLPNKLTSVGPSMFDGCSNLTNITIPSSVTSIKDSAFRGCTRLVNITIPKSVKFIGDHAFNDTALRAVFYDGTKSEWRSLKKGPYNEPLNSSTIHCSDGDISISITNMTFYSWTGDDIPMDIDWRWDDFNGASTLFRYNFAATGLVLSAAAEKSQISVEAELRKIGFETVKSKDFNTEWIEIYRPGVTFGHKTITTDNGEQHAFAIVIRGTTSTADKITDIASIGDRFKVSAANIESEFNSFIQSSCKLNLNSIRNNSKFFITGHSLGGAVANNVAKDLNSVYGEDNIFAYTFASPKTAMLPSLFSNLNIINILNKEDGWTYLPPTALFRYGREYRFHRNDLGTKFSDYYKKLTGQNFNNGDAHAVEVYMSYILTKDNGNSARVMSALCRIACPVDIEIYTSEGQLAGRVINNVAENAIPDKVFISVENDIKNVYLLDNDDYIMKFTGTDKGTMEYTIQGLDLSNCMITNEKVFSNVSLTKGKKMSSKISVWDKTNDAIDSNNKVDIPEVQLFILDDDGNVVKEILSDGEGTEVYIPRTVTFDANGGTVEPTTMETGTDGKLTILPLPTRSGYELKGWYTATNGGTQITTDTIFVGDTVVYAQWNTSNSNSENVGNGSDANSSTGSNDDADSNLINKSSKNNANSSEVNSINNSANKSPVTGDALSIILLCTFLVLAILALCYVYKKIGSRYEKFNK